MDTPTPNQEEPMTTRKITLFDRRPVDIDEDKWPIIASASDCDDRKHPFQANREWILKIRKEDRPTGHLTYTQRWLVYGVYRSKFETDTDLRGGYLVASNNEQAVVKAVRDLVERLGFDSRLGDEVIADMPAEELS
jgi:hypothetical protein